LLAGGTIWMSRGVQFLQDDVRLARPTLMNGSPFALELIRRRVEEEANRRSGPLKAVAAWAIATGRARGAPGPDRSPRLRQGLAGCWSETEADHDGGRRPPATPRLDPGPAHAGLDGDLRDRPGRPRPGRPPGGGLRRRRGRGRGVARAGGYGRGRPAAGDRPA